MIRRPVARALNVIAVVTLMTPVFSQPAIAPAFDVATVKAVPPPDSVGQYNINLGTIRNDRLTLTKVTLSDCLKFAYGIISDAQITGPDWIKSKVYRFDIVAQAAPGTPREQMLVMLQTLLADRLKLALHHEQRELPYLALVRAKNGPKLREAPADASPPGAPMVLGRIVSPRMTMATLAGLLSRFERQTILDKTGLNGTFDVKLEWDWHRNRAIPPGGDAVGSQEPSESPDAPSLFTALEQQLGLKLESRKGMLDVLVVDRGEKIPGEN